MATTESLNWPSRVVVIGAGAMGSVFGAAFATAGFDTVLIDKRKEHVSEIENNGLIVEGMDGDKRISIPAFTEPERSGSFDLAVIFVDSANTEAGADTARQVLKPSGFALTLQNGIGNVETLETILGADRVIAGSTYISAAYLGPGKVSHSNVGETVIGALDGHASAIVDRLADLLTSFGFPTITVENVMGHIWLKFVLNCALNPVCAATGLRPGEVMRVASSRALLELVLNEIMAVVETKGINLPVPDAREYVLDHGWTRYNRPSMLQHVEAGLKPEIEALNGALVREGQNLGVPVPVNEALSAIVLAIAERNYRRSVQPHLNEAALESAAKKQPRR